MGVLDYFNLSGKVSIVTGGGSGLGFAMAEGLAEAGSDIVLCSRKEDVCRHAATEIQKLGVRAAGIKCDITNPNDITELRDFVLGKFGQMDILVNNSAATWGEPTEEYSIKGWKKVIDVNVTGTFQCTQILGRVMIEKGGGKIVNISSIYGSVGTPSNIADAIAYNTSKGAMEAFTKDLAVKWAKYGIHVNAIAPSWIETALTKVTMERTGKYILAHIPMGRYGTMQDLKGAVVYLSSPASDYVTGTTLYVDGGYRAT